MWLGNLWWLWKHALHTIVSIVLPGGLPLERAMVCANSGFAIHRNNEFMFLMLGETVLQIIVAIAPGEVGGTDTNLFFNNSTATAACGFILASTMMFSFRSMVQGQLSSYKLTNSGLGQKSTETDSLMQAIQSTQTNGQGQPPRPSDGQQRGSINPGLPMNGCEKGGARLSISAYTGSGGPGSNTPGRLPHKLCKRMIDTSALDTKYAPLKL